MNSEPINVNSKYDALWFTTIFIHLYKHKNDCCKNRYVIPRSVIDWPLYIDISIMSVSMI